MTSQRTLVTSALPYANGPIHFGHVAGAYLPADVYVRYKRLRGEEVLYVCGTDEHGAPISINAEKAGQEPAEYAARWHEEIKGNFDRLNIRFDNFSRTSNALHHETTLEFFADLQRNGYIEARVEDQLWCEQCQRGLPDRYVFGECPECGFDKARGDECQSCGHSYEATDLKNPRCHTCERPAIRKPSKHWYLDLPKLKEKLDTYHAERFPSWRSNVVGELKKYMGSLRPRAITRDLSWGIPVPLEEAKGKVFYVWFDAPIGYVTSTKEWALAQGKPEAWKDWWQGSDTKLVHFIGKDNIAFHGLIFPGMLLGQDADYVLPDVPANEFLNLEGRKFSTSEGWTIPIDTFCKRFPPDALRWTLTRGAPESKDSEFTYKDFQTKVNTELLGTFANLANRVLKFVKSKYEGTIPAAEAPLSEAETTALKALATGVSEVGAALEGYSSRSAAQKLLEVAYAANKLIDATEPFKTIKSDPPAAATAINTACRILEGLAILLEPFVPTTAKRLWAQLGLPARDFPACAKWESAAAPADPAGRKIGKVKHLFKRIEDEVVEQAEAVLRGEAPAKEETKPKQKKKKKPKAPPPGPAAEIDFATFASLDLRMARVVEAGFLEGADKLLKLTLELKDGEQRTVLSGIRQWYAPEDLVGRQVVYLANLAPRKIRGVVSQGMVLAANDTDGGAVLLGAEREVPDGNSVS